MRWGEDIPIGVLFRCDRPSYESRISVFGGKTLLERCEA